MSSTWRPSRSFDHSTALSWYGGCDLPTLPAWQSTSLDQGLLVVDTFASTRPRRGPSLNRSLGDDVDRGFMKKRFLVAGNMASSCRLVSFLQNAPTFISLSLLHCASLLLTSRYLISATARASRRMRWLPGLFTMLMIEDKETLHARMHEETVKTFYSENSVCCSAVLFKQ